MKKSKQHTRLYRCLMMQRYTRIGLFCKLNFKNLYKHFFIKKLILLVFILSIPIFVPFFNL